MGGEESKPQVQPQTIAVQEVTPTKPKLSTNKSIKPLSKSMHKPLNNERVNSISTSNLVSAYRTNVKA